MTSRTAYPAVYALLRAAAGIGDMWVQTDRCARLKGAHDDDDTGFTSADGRRACAHHVATYTLTQGLTLVAGNRLLGLGLRPSRIAAALAVSAATHYVADRRRPLRRLAEATGKGAFYNLTDHGMNGAFHLDQAFHAGAEAVAAYVAVRD